jgi:hypothetical protein
MQRGTDACQLLRRGVGGPIRLGESHTLCTYNKYQQEAESPNSHVNSRLDEMDKAHNLQLDWGNGIGMDTEIVRFVHFVQSGIHM